MMHLGATIKLDDLIANNLTAGPIYGVKDQNEAELAEARAGFEAAGIVAAQTGAYCNLISTDEAHRKECIASVRETLEKAEKAGVRWVVVGGGHRDPAVPTDVFSAHPDNWSDKARRVLAESCIELLDGWSSQTTGLVVETWVMTPVDSPAASRALAQTVNHKNFGILFDPVNMMNLDRHFRTGDFVAECVDVFGDWIRLVHLKDTKILADRFTYHMAEVPIGDGKLDYLRLLQELDAIEGDLPLLVEHLSAVPEYVQAIGRVREFARTAGVEFAAHSKTDTSTRAPHG